MDSTVHDEGGADAHEAGPSDAGDASVTDASEGGNALHPCTTAGDTNCVQCAGNTKAPIADKTCTPTEAKLVQHDIDKHIATAPGADPAGSCYACMYAATCLDDTQFGDSAKECGDPLGTGTAAECLEVIDCILGSSCSNMQTSDCYCGSAPLLGSCSATPSGANGTCASQIAAGLPFPVTDGVNVTGNYTDVTRAAGKADALFNCAVNNSCSACLQ
jgi:hypothetical protein